MLNKPSHVPRDPLPGFDIGGDRRRSERFAVAEDQAWIGWWEGKLYRKSPAALVDISQGGVRLVAESAPIRRSTVWVCLSGRHQTEWVEGTALEVRRLASGSFDVRLAFREVCPYAFFEVAVCGPPAMVGPAGPA